MLPDPTKYGPKTSCPVPQRSYIPKKFNWKAGNHRRFGSKNLNFDVILLVNKSRTYLLMNKLKNWNYWKTKALKAKYGHPFVNKPHSLCLEEVHVICATTLIAKILNKGKHSVFHMQYVVISPYKTRSPIRLCLRSLGWRFLSVGRSYQPTKKFWGPYF